MPKKQKSQSCSTGWCKHHVFQLLPLKNSSCYYRKKIKLRLCPKHNPSSNRFLNSMPLVNPDQKHYTPCFILEDEKNYYHDNDMKLLNGHNLKLESEGDCTILVAKHGRKKNYCSVCKSQYEDYLQHLDQPSHRLNLRSNKFSKYILQMARDIQQQNTKEIETLSAIIQPISKNVDETKELEKLKERID